MKRILLFTLFFGVLGSISFKAKAQDDSYFGMYFSMGLPVGKLGDYVGKYSWRGFGMEYRQEISDNVLVGVKADWNVFYEEKSYATYEYNNQALSGKQYRYTNAFPMAVTPSYYKDLNEVARVTAGLGIGTTYLMRDTDFGIYRIENNTWQFLLAPEVNVTFDLDANRSAYLGVRYNNNFKSNDLDGQSWISFNVGLLFIQ